MGRVIHTDGPGKRRSQKMRDCAELMRHLVQKQSIDQEAQDMLAALVFILREIDEGLEESVVAWEKRDYWVKAEHFRHRWAWVGRGADDLDPIVREQHWEQVPVQLANLLPNFADITINRFTRTSELWDGMYERLINERS